MHVGVYTLGQLRAVSRHGDIATGILMEEIRVIVEKYSQQYISEHLLEPKKLNQFATVFFEDVAEIYDAITRVRNIDRNPTGFDLNDAPVLGLLVRVWKLLKEIVRYYKEDNGDFISILERPLIEASTVATYLLTSDPSVTEDYRKCSYKDRLRIFRDLKSGSAFYNTKAGRRLLISVKDKMNLESLTEADFDVQKKNRWKLDGKTFFDIFSEIEHEDLYACTYGMMSESIHGSWNESMDFCLVRKDDGTFSAYPFYQNADIRYVSPALRFTYRPYRLWLKRIKVEDPYIASVLDWIECLNTTLFHKFDEQYEG